MRIVMLGHTGVGKTTYMASLYGAMQQSIEGFSLRAVKLENHYLWKGFSDGIQCGKYPVPTDQRQDYQFYLRYQGLNVLEFTWADYLGGTLQQKQDSEQAQALLADLKTADGLILFFESSTLITPRRNFAAIGRVITLTTQALKELDRPISVAIVLTKTDLVDEFPKTFLDCFNGLITAISLSDKIIGAIIPIACGRKLCNVAMPLLFALHATVKWQATSTRAAAEFHEATARSYEDKSRGFTGAMNWIVSKLDEQPTPRQMAEQERSQAAAKVREFENIRDPAESLSYYVQKLPLIKSDLTPCDYVEQLAQIRTGILRHSPKPQDPFSMFDELS